MNTVPLWAQLTALPVLIFMSACFSMTETALLVANRHKLRHLAKNGHKLAITTMWLLDRTDSLLSLLLICNTLINALITALATSIAITTFGNNEAALPIVTALVTFLLVVFAEISPKIIGATYPEKISLPASLILKPLLTLARPAIWFVNLFVSRLLRILRLKPLPSTQDQQRLSPEELRSIVLEGGNFIPQKHRSILLNLFDLESISVDDIMTPRVQVEALNLDVPICDIKRQLATCYHNKLLVYEGEINHIVGILHVRKALALLDQTDEITSEHIRQLLSAPYFIPPNTPIFSQLQYFQENHERLGIIVDEYGEIQGLVTLEDIIEEMIGEFTTSMPGAARGDEFCWNSENFCIIEGATALRDINKRLGLQFPLDGPKTINGLMLDILQEIPEASVAIKFDHHVIEIVHAQNQAIKTVKLIRLKADSSTNLPRT